MSPKKTSRKRAHRLVEQGKRAISVRMTGLGRSKAAPPKQQPIAPEPFAALFADVVPLAGPRRIPKGGTAEHIRKPKKTRASELVSGNAHRFVIERDELRIEAYREDLGPSALTPLSAARWAPQDRIDLHGKRADSARRELARDVCERAQRGIGRLLLIHGKGLHTAGGVGVLKELVVEALTASPASMHVRAFCTAPGRLGGHGALVVELQIDGDRLRSPRRRLM